MGHVEQLNKHIIHISVVAVYSDFSMACILGTPNFIKYVKSNQTNKYYVLK